MRKKFVILSLLLIFFGNNITAMLKTIPDEVLKEHMLPYLPYQDLIQLRDINKRFRELANREITEKKPTRFYLDKEKITHKFNAFKKMLKIHNKIFPESTITIETKNMQKYGFREKTFVAKNQNDIQQITSLIKGRKECHELLSPREMAYKEKKEKAIATAAGCGWIFCCCLHPCWSCTICAMIAACYHRKKKKRNQHREKHE